jgi:hypothetical protein
LILVVAFAHASVAMASVSAVDGQIVPHVDGGSTSLDKKGCPIFHQNGASAPELSAGPGEHCVSLPTSLVAITTSEPGGGCVQNEYIQIRLPKNVVDYAAVWYSTIGLGTRWWSGGATLGPNSVTGLGEKYQVPDGYGAWSGAGGSGASGGCAPPTGTLGVAGWGVTGKYKISGTLTTVGSGQPAPRIDMQASCPGGGRTTTDDNGNYAYLVDPNTTCTVAPQLKSGLKSTPTQRVVRVTRGDVNHVDFKVPCDALSAATNQTTRAVAASGSSANPCKLYVKVSPEHDKFHAGLSFQPADPSNTPDGGPLFAYRGVRSNAGNEYCFSGCALLDVTVKDAQGNPVDDATLTASVTAIATNPVLKKTKSDEGRLCTEGAKPECGRFLKIPPPIQGGAIQLVYWAPGVIDKQKPVVTVNADEDCTAGVCPSMRRHGSDDATLTVYPNHLAARKFTLDHDLKQAMLIWARAYLSSGVLNAIGDYLAPSPSGVVQSLADHVLDAGEADPLFSFGSAAVQVAYSAYSDAKKVEQEFAAVFLGNKGFDLPEVGLGYASLLGNPIMDWCFTCHNLDPLVQGKFLTDFANWILSGIRGQGSLYKLAKQLDRYGVPDVFDNKVHAYLQVIDVSNCQSSNTVTGNADSWYDCGPGYFDDGTVPPTCASNLGLPADHEAWQDMRGYVYVRFSATIQNNPKPLVDDTFAVPYNPFDWQYAWWCGSRGG